MRRVHKSLMLKKILIALALIVITFLIAAAMQPSDYRVVRRATIAAPPAVVFGNVNDLHKFQEWSPWAKLDPAAKMTFEGPPAGTGAIVKWAGNNEVGEGQMTIIESRPNELIRFKLDFVKPFAGTSDAEWMFQQEGSNQTAVSWSMSGKKNFISKAISVFMDMDQVIGGQFEKGLASLKALSEAGTAR
jgi:uncharacterized protein YndB with AHSA1/START domain